MPVRIIGANAGGPRKLAMRKRWSGQVVRTNYWGQLSVPAFYGGLLAVGGGAALGLGVGFILQRMTRRGAEVQITDPDG